MTVSTGNDSLGTRRKLTVAKEEYHFYSIEAAEAEGIGSLKRLPASLRVILENLLRNEDGETVTKDDIAAFADWVAKGGKTDREIAYRPARVLMQDFTGVPAVVDLAAMRDAMKTLGGDPQKINPLSPVDLVIDHSVMVDQFGTPHAFKANVEREYERNGERYEFLKWGQGAFDNFRVVPPGTGICHQVNLEYLSQTIWTDEDKDGNRVAYPDTLVGTDSHTTMVNALAVLGWGVGGIEAEAAMLGQPISMLIPEVVGFKLTGAMTEGVTATDLVLRVVEMLREHGVVGKFVEFYGDGLEELSLADRATISNMAPEYGATCGFFPVDRETLRYLRTTGRDEARISLVEAYAKVQGLWRDNKSTDPVFSSTLDLDISTVRPAISGPKRPQDRILLDNAASAFNAMIHELRGGAPLETGAEEAAPGSEAAEMNAEGAAQPQLGKTTAVRDADYEMGDGHIVIAAITSCTNTSNPYVMIGAGLVAQKAVEKGLKPKPWVKTSLAPGSKVVTEYLVNSGVQKSLDEIGYDLVGYGCTTCIGNSGPLPEPISEAINEGDLVACSVLSGNRNFEGRVNPDVRANYLASPPLVVAYSLLGTMTKDITTEPLGQDKDGNDVFLKDIWPTQAEINKLVEETVTREAFQSQYADVFAGDDKWQGIDTEGGDTYGWPSGSTYVQNPPYFEGITPDVGEIHNVEKARILALLGDSITTDHISPAGSIAKISPAADYLQERQVGVRDFNSYGARRGNHEVMMRGTFGNIRIRNLMAPGTEGGVTKHIPSGEVMPIFDAAMKYKAEDTPLVIIAGKEYGTGSSRDWAAKGTALLGVKAVIAESYERIHRSNLVGMGVVPLQFTGDDSRDSLGLSGEEVVTVHGLSDVTPRATVKATIDYADGKTKDIDLLCRIDTATEIDYVKNGGVLHYVLRDLAKDEAIAAQ
jgi:aconitate hydratase